MSVKAVKLFQEMHKSVRATLVKNYEHVVRVNPQVDIYNPEEKEVLLFDDGIQVKGQKSQRHPKAQLRGNKRQGTLKTKTLAAVTIDVVLLPKATGGFEYVVAPIDGAGKELLSLTSVVRAKVIQEYGKEINPLHLVVITDGTRAICHRLLTLFRATVTVILNGNYLGKKLRQLMSMIAVNKVEKASYLKFLIPQLWLGLVDNDLEYLQIQISVRNQEK